MSQPQMASDDERRRDGLKSANNVLLASHQLDIASPEYTQRRRGQVERTELGDEHHVDRGNRHLEKVRADQRNREGDEPRKLLPPGRGAID